MKKIILSLSFLFFVLAANAQQNKYLVDERGNPKHYSVARRYAKCNIYLLVDGGTKKITPFDFISSFAYVNPVLLNGATEIELETRIQKDSLKYYRYSIIENDSVIFKNDLIPSKVKYVWGKKSELPDYLTIDLGKFNVVDKKIEVRIYRIFAKTNVTSVIIYNKPVKAPQIIYYSILNKRRKDKKVVSKAFKNGDSIAINEYTYGVRIAMQNTDMNLLYDVTLENKDGHGMNMLGSKWTTKNNIAVFDINARNFKTPGKYTVNVYPKTETFSFLHNSLLAKTIEFSVKKNKTRLFSEKQLIIYGLILCAVCGAIFGALVTYIKKKEAKKLALQYRDKEIAKLQLESVRSQLNPHFLFNALAGIQTLMNKNEIDNANRYLTKFARLTRNVLDHKDLISLTGEKTLLDDYLQMEQLRFGFQYLISASPDLDVENIEIPAMLLQPFVENAVKHGIAEKGSDGKIEISFTRQTTDLILSIKDNGYGLDVTKNYTGLGLALTKNRISLLNSIYKENQFLLEMKADLEGTIIKITLSQWL